MKEAAGLSTGLARTRFTSQQAQRWLKGVGFKIHARLSPGLPTDAIAAAPGTPFFDVSSLAPLTSTELSVEFTWLRAGELSLDGDGLPLFPLLPDGPGLYRFDLGVDEGGVRALYVGESSSFRRRASNYRNAKTDRSRQRTSRRIHNEVVTHLGNGGSIESAIITEILVGGEKADLRLRSARRPAENAAVFLEQMTRDVTVMNIDETLPNDSSPGPVD